MPLIAMAPHSVPVLVRNLEHPSNRVKMEVLQVLGKLADKSFCLAKGYDRNISFLEEIIEGYQREKDHDVKVDYLSILNFFNDVAPEKNELAVKILREVINNETDKSLRSTAAMSLLRVSKVDGINEVINRLDDISFFGKQGCLEVIYVLRDVLFEYTEDRYIPIDRLKLWWQENKDRLEAEKAEAAAARENNQMNADTTEKTQPETNRTTGGR